MELLIKLPEGYVGTVMRNQKINGSAMDKMLRQAVIDGIPLPKGHGDLIDRDEVNELEERLCATECDCCTLDGCFYDRATTIIEADRSEEE